MDGGAGRCSDTKLVWYVILAQPISRFSALSFDARLTDLNLRPRNLSALSTFADAKGMLNAEKR